MQRSTDGWVRSPRLCSPRPASEPGALSCAAPDRLVSREPCLVSGAVVQGGALVATTWAPWGLPLAHGASPLGALF